MASLVKTTNACQFCLCNSHAGMFLLLPSNGGFLQQQQHQHQQHQHQEQLMLFSERARLSDIPTSDHHHFIRLPYLTKSNWYGQDPSYAFVPMTVPTYLAMTPGDQELGENILHPNEANGTVVKIDNNHNKHADTDMTHVTMYNINSSSSSSMVGERNGTATDETMTGSATSMIMIASIGFYKDWISPLLPPACRFVPTCSQYGVQAIQTYGPWKGFLLIIWRLLRCSPVGGKGYDPPRWPPVPFTHSSYWIKSEALSFSEVTWRNLVEWWRQKRATQTSSNKEWRSLRFLLVDNPALEYINRPNTVFADGVRSGWMMEAETWVS